jgi:5-methylcytosine-specific restriction endonuclease McrA
MAPIATCYFIHRFDFSNSSIQSDKNLLSQKRRAHHELSPEDPRLQRDCWRCQICGTMSQLEVHYQPFRSHSGQDTEENLITLCHDCHSAEHGE